MRVRVESPQGWVRRPVDLGMDMRTLFDQMGRVNSVIEMGSGDNMLFICGGDQAAADLIAAGNLNVIMIPQFVDNLKATRPKALDLLVPQDADAEALFLKEKDNGR